MNSMVLKGLLAKVDSDLLTHEEQVSLRSAILEQVDQAAAIERGLEVEAAALRDQARIIMESARELEHQREKFLGYIKSTMQAEGFEKLPGERYEVILKTNPPKLIIDTDPSEFDAEAYPTLVKAHYKWDLNRIKALISMGSTIKWARLEAATKVEFKQRRVK